MSIHIYSTFMVFVYFHLWNKCEFDVSAAHRGNQIHIKCSYSYEASGQFNTHCAWKETI